MNISIIVAIVVAFFVTIFSIVQTDMVNKMSSTTEEISNESVE